MSISQDIVITGTGLVTCLGLSPQETWEAMHAGRCGIAPAPALECKPDPDPGSGQAPDLPADEAPQLPRVARYLRHALKQALAQANLPDALPYAPERCGLMLATTLHGMRAAGQYLRTGQTALLTQLPAGKVTELATQDIPVLSNLGLSATTCNACASGLASIAMAAMLLRSGQYDLVIAGGYDTLSEYAFAGFSSLRLVSTQPQRPFAHDRTGLKLSEGYGIVILERAADAQKRGARPLARIAGAGESSDAYHLSHPHPHGQGAAEALRGAMKQAGLSACDLDLIVAHATATPDNDASEFKALAIAMGSELPRIPITAMKSHLGHTLGGAGAVELILACESLNRGKALPVANVREDDVAYPGMNVVTGQARPISPRAAVCLSAGFGGANTAVVITPPSLDLVNEVSITDPRIRHRAVITGVGLIAPGPQGQWLTCDELAVRLQVSETKSIAQSMLQGQGNGAALDELLLPRKTRRLSPYVKLTLAAILQAARQAGIDQQADAPQAAAILATKHGSPAYCFDFYNAIVQQGLQTANPLLFAEGVPNAGAAHLSMALNFHGPCQTLLGTRTAGLDAVHLARVGIESGHFSRVLICAAEEQHTLVDQSYATCRLFHAGEPEAAFGNTTGFNTVEAGAAVIIESEHAALARGARILAYVEASGCVTWPQDLLGDGAQRVANLLGRLGNPQQILTSANATWLDRVELLGARQAGRSSGATSPATLSTLYGYVGECFSAMPLVGLAAMLTTGKLPRLLASGFPQSNLLRPAGEDEPLSHAALLASDYHGMTTGITIRMPGDQG